MSDVPRLIAEGRRAATVALDAAALLEQPAGGSLSPETAHPLPGNQAR